MKTINILFLCCCISTTAFSQQYLVDSLVNLLQKETDPIQKIDLQLGLARAYYYTGDYELQSKIVENAHQLSIQNNHKEGELLALLEKGFINYFEGSTLEEELDYYDKAAEIAKTLNSNNIDILINHNKANFYVFSKVNYPIALDFLNKALNKLKADTPPTIKGNLYKNYAYTNENLGKDSLAISYYKKALLEFNKVKDNPWIHPITKQARAIEMDGGSMNEAQTYIYLGYNYAINGKYDLALEMMKEGLSIYEASGALLNVAFAKEAMGNVALEFGETENALKVYNEAIEIYKQKGLPVELNGVYQNAGELFLKVRDLELAQDYFDKALEISIARNDSTMLMESYHYQGKIALKKEDYDKAIELCEKSKTYAIGLNDHTIYSLLDVYIGKSYAGRGNTTKALYHLKEALKTSKQYQYERYILESSLSLSSTYLTLSQLDTALHYANIAQMHAMDLDTDEKKLEVEKILSEIYAQQKDYQNAYQHHQSYFSLNEKLHSAGSQKQFRKELERLNVLHFQKEKEQAERAASLLASRNKLYLVLGGILLFMLIIGSYLLAQVQKIRKQLESQNLQLQQLNATKDKFFGIIAHDVRSPIVALDGVGEQMEYYLKKDKKEKLIKLASRVDSTAKRLSGLLDNLLNWALLQQGVIPYHPKSLNVKRVGESVFNMFQNNAEAKGIELITNIDADLHVQADESAMQTILRNLVSNAIKFTPSGGKVSISTETKDDKVFININDTGTGISAEKMSKLFSLEKQSEHGTAGEKGTGLGLTLVKELAELNKGIIAVTSRLNEGSRFSIGLPQIV